MRERPAVVVRPAVLDDVPGMSRVFVDTFRSAHRGQMPEDLLLGRTYVRSARGWERTLRERDAVATPEEQVWVAEDDAGEVVGLAMGGPARPWQDDETARAQRPTGECYALYVDPPGQGAGVGRALLAALAGYLLANGRDRMVVGVLAANRPARGFYERVGGVLLGSREFDDEGVLLPEVVYGWDDLADLAAGAA